MIIKEHATFKNNTTPKRKSNIIYLRLTFILFVFPLLFSCSEDLSRTKACEIIKKQLEEKVETQNFRIDYYATTSGGAWKAELFDPNPLEKGLRLVMNNYMVKKFKQAGIINKIIPLRTLHKRKSYGKRGGYYYWGLYRIEFIDNVKQFILEEFEEKDFAGVPIRRAKVLIGKIVFDSITGIIEKSKNKRVVEFKYKKEYTPFGKILFDQGSSFKNAKANFLLYDDGWRLTEIDL